MGCANSKRLDSAVAAEVYHLPPSSIALFDISKIEEPWLLTTGPVHEPIDDKPPKPGHVPLSLLEKLDSFELAPKPWSEVSKALEDLKPSLHQTLPPAQATAKIRPSSLLPSNIGHASISPPRHPPPELVGFRSVKENSFVVRDRQEREGKKEAEELRRWKIRNPLERYPERRPPGNSDGVVIYTTTLRGVRRTFEDCERLRQVVEGHAVEAGLEVDERDVSLHGDYLKQVRELVGEGVVVPRLFVAGRYVGGVQDVVELAETGKLGEMMRWVARRMGGERGKGGRRVCEGCGGARFVPCTECNGSCKVVAEDGKGVERCGMCNENGLAMCPMCH
ncbi:glutaredoxin domain-containing cysteine-rich protein CG12206 isoform X2 [Phalaenopsis equestris]|uniref:glutaredoxin domain-containing cysteine-rich protein CG12206 isoform X1 n=1 Tax=Phalaenopsis equestris TaxID=78828 RepID=UPI0009E6465D|nr:glutaredoxin domain-containing cysteine-rich protein CG12206 isoform X1 [Phalaenopsis equestris]XP_020597484.1 glutaredoxin domain-containing cysteine-rich protein CG12206 isoform X2 [Phalaenopsis equestris]